MLELDPAQHDLSREQVGEPVAHPHAGQVGEQRAGRVPHHQVLEYKVVQEGA